MKLLICFIFAYSAIGQTMLSGVLASGGAASGGTVATPTDSKSGTCSGASPTWTACSGTVVVTLTDATGGATICYRLDGTNPAATTPGTCDGGSTTYSGTFNLTATTTVKALGTKAGSTNSSILSSTYTFAGAIGTPAGSQFSTTSAANTAQSAAQTTTAGDTLFVYASTQSACPGGFGQTGLPTDTGGDTFTPVVPSGGAYILGAAITNGGSGCVSDPSTCTISGGGGSGATCTATASGGAVNSVNIGGAGAGDYTSPATISISGSSCTGVTAQIVAYGVGPSTSCSMAWYAKNVAGTTNNQVTANFGPAASYGFNGISVAKTANLNASTPLDVSPGIAASAATSITSPSFTTANAAEIALCGSRVEAITQTWTAGGSYALVSGATASDTFQTIEYQIFSSIQTGVTASISSGANAIRGIICGVFKQ